MQQERNATKKPAPDIERRSALKYKSVEVVAILFLTFLSEEDNSTAKESTGAKSTRTNNS
jgi:hypothetical protein